MADKKVEAKKADAKKADAKKPAKKNKQNVFQKLFKYLSACKPPAKMTAFIVKGRPFPEFLLVWTACRLFMLCSVVGYKWPQPQSTGMVSSSRIQSATGTTVYAVLVLRITTRSIPALIISLRHMEQDKQAFVIPNVLYIFFIMILD